MLHFCPVIALFGRFCGSLTFHETKKKRRCCHNSLPRFLGSKSCGDNKISIDSLITCSMDTSQSTVQIVERKDTEFISRDRESQLGSRCSNNLTGGSVFN
jgi:hypothetical protein